MINDMITKPRARTGLFCAALFFLLLLMASANAEDTVVAVVNNENIYASDLEKLITQYKKRARKQELTLDELKQLVNNLAIRMLILQHPDAQALKNDAEIRRKVKVFEEGLIVSDFVPAM